MDAPGEPERPSIEADPIGPAVGPVPPDVGPVPPDVGPAPPATTASRPTVALHGTTAISRGLALLIVLAAGLVVVSARTVSLLARELDPDLASTNEIAQVEGVGDPLFLAFIVAVAIVALLTIRWMSRVRRTIGQLALRGAVVAADGDVLFARAGVADERRAWLDVEVRATRRLPRLVALWLATAVVGTVAAVVLRLVAVDPASARVAAVIGLATGLAWVIAASLAGALVENVDRRQRAALRAVDPLADPVPDAPRAWAMPAIAILATLAAAFALGPSERPYDDRACPAPETSCHIVTVQRDQLDGGPRGATVDVTYAIRPAGGERRGTFLYITGGPGSSGILDGGLFLRAAPTRLLDAYDVVLFDPRGVGRSEPLDCPAAASDYAARSDPSDLAASSAAFASGCIAEAAPDAAVLPTYGSDHVADDIDAIRSVLDVDRLVVYGASYGTVVAQRYAVRHPEHVEALMLDGPVDPAQGTIDFWVEADHGFDATLKMVLASCSADSRCSRALPDPPAELERLLTRLNGKTIDAGFADPDGTPTSHLLGRAAVLSAIGTAMYDTTGRMLFLHALASSATLDDVPLGRLVGLPPTVSADPWESDFAYYATLCGDFTGPTGGSPAGYIDAGRGAGAFRGTLVDVYTSALPCVGWPGMEDGRPPRTALAETPFPVVVFSGGADPITPPSQANRIAARLSDGYLFETVGGPHGNFARGDPCTDDVVLGLLLDGQRPKSRTVRCPGAVTDPYVDVLPTDYDALQPIDIGRAIDDEILTEPAYRSWVYTSQVQFGCRFGGRVQVRDEGDAHAFTFDACEIFFEQPIDGTGRYSLDAGTHFEIHLPDGDFSYDIDTNGTERASGEFRRVRFVASG